MWSPILASLHNRLRPDQRCAVCCCYVPLHPAYDYPFSLILFSLLQMSSEALKMVCNFFQNSIAAVPQFIIDNGHKVNGWPTTLLTSAASGYALHVSSKVKISNTELAEGFTKANLEHIKTLNPITAEIAEEEALIERLKKENK